MIKGIRYFLYGNILAGPGIFCRAANSSNNDSESTKMKKTLLCFQSDEKLSHTKMIQRVEEQQGISPHNAVCALPDGLDHFIMIGQNKPRPANSKLLPHWIRSASWRREVRLPVCVAHFSVH
jgi:hypothetical protein